MCQNSESAASDSFSSVTLILVLFFSLYMATQETFKPLLLSAMLGSKDEVALIGLFFPATDLYLDIEVEGVDEDLKRSYYSVSIYVADIKVAKSKKSKPQSSVVKWEWKENNQM